MRKIQRILIFILLLFVCVFASFNSTKASADTVKTDDGQYNYTTTSEDKRTIVDGAEVIVNNGYTTRGTVNYDQRVTMYTCDTAANSDIKIATWAIPNESGTGFIRRGLLEIAKSYEENNPGWVVLGGINADQYFATLGTSVQTNGSYLYVPQPYYPMISNGENWFTVSAYGYATFSSVVGFKNDGSNDPFVNGTRQSKGFYIHVYDDKMNEIGAFPADGLDCELGANKTVILASYRSSTTAFKTITRTGSNDIYVVENPEMSYVSNSKDWTSVCQYATDAFFGKGTISKIAKTVTFKNEKGFAIETTNEALKAKLSVGTYVKVQMDFDDAMNGIQEAVGYHTVQRKDGKDLNVANSYNTRAYPRSWFGCDDAGKIYLMTCFGDNSSPTTGLFAQEMNAYCKAYGITDAFQMDGGGSVTSVVRAENGDLEYAEACIEESHKQKELAYSEYRYVLSGLFVVMKAPDVPVEVSEKTSSSVKLTVDTTKVQGKYDEVSMKVKNAETGVFHEYNIDLTKDTNVFEVKNLKSDSEYYYEFFTVTDGEEQRGFAKTRFYTYRQKSVVTCAKAIKTATGYDITLNYQDDDNTLVQLTLQYGGKDYACEIDYKNKVATVSVEGFSSLLDIKLNAESVFDLTTRVHSTVEIDIEGFMYPVEFVFTSAVNEIGDMIKKFCH